MLCDWCLSRAFYVIVEPEWGGCTAWRTQSCFRCLMRWLRTYVTGTRVEAI